ncbi:fumarylacetoacetate hydrolase family protein [Aquibium sp. LZ166]|uniref:Fumarylacetoacetate hydrolase family protein n=1 Tax=Aquibium pacificus TaxID=3153579 RepID=A0ABV3SEY5_9HYPH
MATRSRAADRQVGDQIAAVAAMLREAEDSGKPCPPILDLLPAGDVEAAYKVQQINIDHKIGSGRRLIGRKIGLTSVAVQRQLGVSEPDYGALLSDMIVGDGETIAFDRLLQPKAEAEIALILGADLDMPSPNLADVLRATAFVLPAIEIVASRIQNWKISLVDTIADNASSGMFVLGTPAIRPEGFSFGDCAMELKLNDEVVSTGSGRACMGNPLNAAAWLAAQMHALGTPLRAGEIIMTGALGPMTVVGPSSKVFASIENLGTVSFNMGDQ